MCVPVLPAAGAAFGGAAGEDLYNALTGSEKSDRQARNQTSTNNTSTNTYNTYQYADSPDTTQRPNESLKISKEKTSPKKSGGEFKEQLNIKPTKSINY